MEKVQANAGGMKAQSHQGKERNEKERRETCTRREENGGKHAEEREKRERTAVITSRFEDSQVP